MTPPSATFVVHERSVISKSETRAGEDGLVVTAHFAAVIDGATTPYALGNDGRTTGKIAMDAVCDVIRALAPDATVEDFLDRSAIAIADQAAAAGLAADLPTAVAVVYSAARNEIWSVGDARWKVEGVPQAADRRDIDALAAQARAVILKAALLRGATVDELRADDIGRAGSAAIREAKVTFRNNLAAGPYAFAALTGTPVPRELVDVIAVPAGAGVILASDGYLDTAPTLEEAELDLAAALAADPLCIDIIAATKCTPPGATSFDDRTYLRLTART